MRRRGAPDSPDGRPVRAGRGRARCAGAVAALGALVLAAGCGGGPAVEEPLTTTGCMVSAPAGFEDASIGQLVFGEFSNAHDEAFLGRTSAQRVSTADGTQEALARYADQSCTLGVLVGPGGAEALADVASGAPDTAWLAVSTGGHADYPDNVVTIDFDLVEPAFLAGYAAAARSETGRVAVFASYGFAHADALLEAFDAGVAQRNDDAGTDVTSFRGGAEEARTVDDTAAAGREYTSEAFDRRADVITPFASGAASGVLDAFERHDERMEVRESGDDSDSGAGADGVADAEGGAGGDSGTGGSAGSSESGSDDAGDSGGEGGAGEDSGDAGADDESDELRPSLVWYGTDGSATLGDLGDRVISSIVPNIAAGFQSTVTGWPETGFAGEIPEPDGEPFTVGELELRESEYVGSVADGGVEVIPSDGLLSQVAGLGRDYSEIRKRIEDGEIELPSTD